MSYTRNRQFTIAWIRKSSYLQRRFKNKNIRRQLFSKMQPTGIFNTPSLEPNSRRFSLIAGPCSIESYEMFRKVAIHVKNFGATALRGGIFKMRTDSHSFQGLG